MMKTFIKFVMLLGLTWACHAQAPFQVKDLQVNGNISFPNAPSGILTQVGPQSTVVPTTKNAAGAVSGAGNTVTATWSAAPVPGEFLVCTAFSAASTTYSLTDSAGNTYTPYGSIHFGTTTALYTQTFYAGPIANTVTTTTTTASAGSFLTMQCNSTNNIAGSSPTDGQATVDTSTSPIQSPTITTTAGGDYIYCAAGANFLESLSAGPGYTNGASANNNFRNQYGTQNAPGAVAPSMLGSVSNAATMTCSAFKAGTAVTPAQTAWDQNVAIANIQAANTPVIPYPPTPSGGDDYSTVQLAINTAIAQNREFLLPPGTWKTSASLVANSANFRMRGSGIQFNGPTNGLSVIQTTGTGYNALVIGVPTLNSSSNSGYLKDLAIFGSGKPAVGSPTGVSCLQISGIVQYNTENVTLGGCDIGLDLVNNDFGSQFANMDICEFGSCNVGIYLRNGNQSGSDISFYNMWADGAFCGVCISGEGGGYHFWGGQINAGQSSPVFNDAAGAVVLNYDYLTGDTSSSSSADFHSTSFEGTQLAWIFRGYGTNFLLCEFCAPNSTNPSNPAIGVYKSTNLQESRIDLEGMALTGYYSNPQLLVMTGSTLGTSFLTENGTYSAAQNATINGVYTYVTSMAAQSGITAVGSDPTGLNANGIWYGNNSGAPAYKTSYAGALTNFFINPLTTFGDFPYEGSSGMTRLAGNTTATDQVLVSHGGAAPTVPTTKTCATSNSGGTGNSATCTWSVAPVAGESIVCGVFNGNSSTLTMTDSATDTYTAYGSQFATVGPTGFSLTFYTAPLSGSITTTTVNSTSGDFLGLQCNSLTNMAASSPTDGQASANTSGTSTIATGAITTTANGDYLFCSLWGQSATTYTVGAGFTAGSATSFVSETEYQTQATAGSITPSFTQGGGLSATLSCAAFKGANGATAPFLTASPLLAFPAINQSAAGQTGGTCSMSTSTSCTVTLGHTYTTPVCIATQQSGTLTGAAVGCTVSGTTATITAAVANSETWGALVFGNPN